MSLTRVFGKASRTVVSQYRNFIFLSPPPLIPHHYQHQASSFHNGLRCLTPFTHCAMSTSASHEQDQEKKGVNKNMDATTELDETILTKSFEQAPETDSNSDSQPSSDSSARRRRASKRTAFSDSDTDSDSEVDPDDLSREELVKVLFEKEEILQKKEKEFSEWKDNFLRSYAEMENVMERTRRDAENAKKFAVQSFAKSLLDVADNLSRASSITKESFSKIDVSKDTIGAVPILKTLLEGVEMTEKQLAEVFRKSGIEKIDPTNEQFDPNHHNAVFQVPDDSKPPGTIAVVLKAGYKLHDRIIRPAEVGVTVAVENDEANS